MATLSVFAAVDVPPLLFNLVFGESVLNDAVAIVLFRTLVRQALWLNLRGAYFELEHQLEQQNDLHVEGMDACTQTCMVPARLRSDSPGHVLSVAWAVARILGSMHLPAPPAADAEFGRSAVLCPVALAQR